MASSAFGFAKAVETLPNYFEFGKSLVGQGKEDLDRAAKEKAYAGELGLRASELALKDEQDRRLMDYRMADLDRQIKADEALTQSRARTAQNEEVKTGIHGKDVDSQVAARQITAPAQANQANAAARHYDITAPAQANQYNSSAQHLDAQTEQANYERKQREENDNYIKAMNVYRENPFSDQLSPSMKAELDAHFNMLGNPEVGQAYQTINNAMRSGRPATPEETALVGNVLQPIIDLGGPGQKFMGFEPAKDGSGVHIRLRNADGKDVYLTKGRHAMAAGGQPDTFSMNDIGQMMGHMRDVASWQETHPEIAQEVADHNEARRMSNTAAEYRRNYNELTRNRLAREVGEEKAAEHDAKTMASRRDNLYRQLESYYDDRAEQLYGEPDPNNPEQAKARQAAKDKFLSVVSSRLKGASKDELLAWDAPTIWGAINGAGNTAPTGASRGSSFNSPVVGGGR